MDNISSEEPEYNYAFATSTGLIVELSVMMVIAIIGNTCTIAAFHLDAALRSNPSDRYILSLAWANLGIGMCAMPTQLICRILWRPLPIIFCRVMYTLDYSFAAVTLYMITLICIDRYFLVSSSYSRYIAIQNRRNIRLTILLAWFLALLVGGTQNLSWGESTHNIFNSYTPCCAGPVIAKKIPLVILYVCYGIIPSVLVAIFGTLFLVALRRRMKRWKEKTVRRTGDYHALKNKRARAAKNIAKHSSKQMPSLRERNERGKKEVHITVDQLSKMEKASERIVTKRMQSSSTETMETDLNAVSQAPNSRRNPKLNANMEKTAPKSVPSSNESSNLSPSNSLPEELEQESAKLLGGASDDCHRELSSKPDSAAYMLAVNDAGPAEGQRGSYSPVPIRRFKPKSASQRQTQSGATTFNVGFDLTPSSQDTQSGNTNCTVGFDLTLASQETHIGSTNFHTLRSDETILQIKEEPQDDDMQDSTEELRVLTPSNNNSESTESKESKESKESMYKPSGKGSFRISAPQENAPEITIDPASCSQHTNECEQIRCLNSNDRDPNKLHRPSIDTGFSFHTLMSHLVSRGSSFRSSFRDMTPKIFKSRYIKPATVFGTLFMGMLICFIPTGVYMIVITTSCPECFDPVIFNYLAFLAYFNSCLNPILYIVSHTKIRRFYQKRFYRICHRD